jgi:hypothetical protein
VIRHTDGISSGLRPFLSRLVAVVTVVFLLFGPHVATFFDEDTRYFAMWRRRDAVVTLGVIVLVAAVGLAIGGLVRRSRRPALVCLCQHLFALAFVSGLLANLYHQLGRWGIHVRPSGILTISIWFVLAAVLAYSFAKRSVRLARICAQTSLIISPAVAIVMVSLLLRRPFDYRQDVLMPAGEIRPVSAGDNQRSPIPVYIFVFDEWSSERTFSEGRVRGEYGHMAAFAEQAVVFQDAHSPGVFTKGIMPRLLFQVDHQPMFEAGETGFMCDGVFRRSCEFKSLFSTFSGMGYRTVMVGTYLPYSAWLGDQVDVCRSYSMYPLAGNPLERVARECWSAMSHWTDPWSQTISLRYGQRLRDLDMLRIYQGVEADIRAIVSGPPSRTFAVFHYMLPHEPFIVNPDGSYRGTDLNTSRSDVDGYLRNLRRLDVLVGDFTQLMRAAGSFDSALVVLTSDHSWRWDPARQRGELDMPRTHVPMLIKMPYQREAVSVLQRVEARELGVLLQWALGPDGAPGRVEEFVRTRQQDGSQAKEALTLAPPERSPAGE